ncbi:MAG: DUF4389 domain-containing protein [Acidimicrobiales bacterium]
MEPTTAYPVSFTFDPPDRIARWRPLLSWLLVIPHAFILYFVQLVASFCVLIAWFAILFTGELPEGLARFPVLLLRYQTRVMTYGMFMQEEYPPFEFPSEETDVGDYPRLRVDVDAALTHRNRLTTFFRGLLVIPHAIVLGLLGVAAAFVIFIAFFAVLFTGRWPDGLRDFLVGYVRWLTRLNGYAMLLTDEYPPFSTS